MSHSARKCASPSNKEQLFIMKNRRHEAILEIITEQPVATQELLIELLAQRGIKTTQATLSRDIQQLSLVKQRDENGVYRYSMPAAIRCLLRRQRRSLCLKKLLSRWTML